MVKINQTNIVLALLISVILGFGLFLAPKIAGANSNFIYNSNTPIGNYGYTYQYPTPIGNSYWYQTPYNAYSYQTPNTAYNYQNYYNPPAAYSYQTPYSNSTNQNQEKDKDKTPGTDASALAANAVYGNSGFLPSGILQWILTAILILVIVILSRKVFGKDKQYLAEPLKHH